MQLEHVDWPAALTALKERHRVDPRARGPLADAASLSALYTADFAAGRENIALALSLEPLNPLHALRQALHLLRFGDVERANAVTQRVVDDLPGLPFPLYIKALIFLRGGDATRAKNVVGELIDAHPTYAPARFLSAEVQLHFKLKGVDKNLASLPKEPEWHASWSDLLAKIVLLHPLDGPAIVERTLASGVPPKGSVAERAVRAVLAMTTSPTATSPNSETKETSKSTLEGLEQPLLYVPPSSREEEMLISLWTGATKKEASTSPVAQARELQALWARSEDRPAVRRLYVARLTRLVVDAAARNDLAAALRAVEVCVRLEPHDTLHHQNRAALFTLLRDEDGYHQAWLDLERLQFRRALMGQLDRAAARSLAKPHRMFAQDARLTAEDPAPHRPKLRLGVFHEEVKDGEPTRLVVNQARLDSDPEQLRQWIHHRAAELVFLHAALGLDDERALLGAVDAPDARARAEGLAGLTRSLAVLVPEEGKLLATALAKRWHALADRAGVSYVVKGADDDAEEGKGAVDAVGALKRAHTETLADVALLCLAWRPDARRPDMVDEVIELMRAVLPFLDDALLFTRAPESSTSTSLSWLSRLVRGWLKFPEDGDAPPVTSSQRALIGARLESRVRLGLAMSVESVFGPERALQHIDRAREIDDSQPALEILAASMLTRSGYFDDARKAIARYRNLAKDERDPDDEERIDAIQRALDKAKSAGEKGEKRAVVSFVDGSIVVDADIAALEAAIEQSPSSLLSYEEICRALMADGRATEAVEWAERAIARCLGRATQLGARRLHLEMLGLAEATKIDGAKEAVPLYLAGAKDALGKLLLDVQEPSAATGYVLGLCHLAAKRREPAQACFARALERCERQIHKAVLRPLADDVEHLLLETARKSIADAIAAGVLDDAAKEVASLLTELTTPEAALVDIARVQLAAAVAGIGKQQTAPPLPPPPKSASATWTTYSKLAKTKTTALETTKTLATLASSAHPPSAKEAASLLQKVAALEAELQLAAHIAASSTLLREGKMTEALAALDDDVVGDGGKRDARVLRQRLLLLLRLGRFVDADAACAALKDVDDAVAREAVARYPSVRFKHAVAVAQKHIRNGELAEAKTLLSTTTPSDDDERVELTFTEAFCAAEEAKKSASKKTALRAALTLAERELALAQKRQHTRFLELHALLEKELLDVEARA